MLKQMNEILVQLKTNEERISMALGAGIISAIIAYAVAITIALIKR